MYLYIDIETIPTSREDVREHIADGVSPPGSMTKPDTIAAWERDTRPSVVADKIVQTSLDGAFGEIAVIGCAVDNDPVFVFSPPEYKTEDDRITEFFGMLRGITPKPTQSRVRLVFVGHNIERFDLRFIMHRAIVHNIEIPSVLITALNARAWDRVVHDTMTMWAGVRDTVSLRKLCLALRIPNDDTITGADVARLYEEGKIGEIVEHCKSDVRVLREVHRRLVSVLGIDP